MFSLFIIIICSRVLSPLPYAQTLWASLDHYILVQLAVAAQSNPLLRLSHSCSHCRSIRCSCGFVVATWMCAPDTSTNSTKVPSKVYGPRQQSSFHTKMIPSTVDRRRVNYRNTSIEERVNSFQSWMTHLVRLLHPIPLYVVQICVGNESCCETLACGKSNAEQKQVPNRKTESAQNKFELLLRGTNEQRIVRSGKCVLPLNGFTLFIYIFAFFQLPLEFRLPQSFLDQIYCDATALNW